MEYANQIAHSYNTREIRITYAYQTVRMVFGVITKQIDV